jgi:hypothetical protein
MFTWTTLELPDHWPDVFPAFRFWSMLKGHLIYKIPVD